MGPAGEGSYPYLLVDLDADGALGDVPDAPGAAVVELVRHALVHRAVHLDVDVLADLVGAQVGGEIDVPLLAEAPREQVARPRPQPMPRRHLPCLLLLYLRLCCGGGGGSVCGARVTELGGGAYL